MGFKLSRKLDDSPNNDRARGPKRQRLDICSKRNQPSEPQLPKGFPPVPPGYESRWQCWADSWRSRHEEARASDQVAFALEDAATVIDRLSAFEARANPDAPNAPFALAVEKALISVDSTEHIVTIMARAYENRVNANASFNEETASVRLLQAVEKRENAQLALERALQKYADEKDKHAAVCAALHQAVDAVVACVQKAICAGSPQDKEIRFFFEEARLHR